MLLLGSNWYLGDTNWYLTIFTLFRRWLELEQRLRQHQHQHRRDRVRLSRGRGRTSSRGRGRAPSPSDTRAVTPPPTEEVIREGEDGETEQVQNEEMPPQPTPEMINQVLAYLSGLSDQGQTPPVFSAPAPQAPEVQHAATQHLRFQRYNMQPLWLLVWMPHWT